MLIYLLSFASGKKYVGQTVRSLAVRISQHRRMTNYGSLLPVHCAWRKHGEPSVQILGEYDDTECLHAAERKFIADLGTISPGGYNVGYGGETAPSKSPSVAAKIAEKAKGRSHSEDARQKIGAGSRDNWQSDEYRQRVLDGVAASFTPERRAHMAEITRKRMKGVPKSEEHKAKLRGRTFSDETRRKMSEAAKLRTREPRSDETKFKIASSTAKSWSDPEIKAKRATAIRAANAERKDEIWTPQRREAMAERNRIRWAKARAVKSSIA